MVYVTRPFRSLRGFECNGDISTVSWRNPLCGTRQLHWILCWRSFSLRSSSRIARRRSLLNSFVLASDAVWCSCNRYDSLSR